MKRRLTYSMMILCTLVLTVTTFAGCGGGDGQTARGDVQVPIRVEGADNVGSLNIVLTYDPAVLEAIEVVAGELGRNAMLEYNAHTAGQVTIGIVDASGITGDGAVAVAGFDLIDDEGSSSLVLATVEAHDATTLVDIITETSAGSLSTGGEVVNSPLLRFPE